MKSSFSTLLFLGLLFSVSAQTQSIAGLTESVEIYTDEYGISHIYAENEADLFFAQGYNAARDRLFQFEVWRRQATGTVAEILGPREIKETSAPGCFCFGETWTRK